MAPFARLALVTLAAVAGVAVHVQAQAQAEAEAAKDVDAHVTAPAPVPAAAVSDDVTTNDTKKDVTAGADSSADKDPPSTRVVPPPPPSTMTDDADAPPPTVTDDSDGDSSSSSGTSSTSTHQHAGVANEFVYFDHFIAQNSTMKCWSDDHVIPFNLQARGTCLGGWLVLEPWITPSLFYQFLGEDESTTATDMMSFCNVLGPVEGNLQLKRHWDTWVTEDVIAELADKGKVNSLRLPVGDWMYEPYGTCLLCEVEYYT
jgi:hypothetical protein